MKADEAELKNEGPKPIEDKKGSVRVKIYQGTKRFTKNGEFYTCPQFALCYYDGARRVRKRFPSLAKATKAAKDAAGKLARVQLDSTRSAPPPLFRYLPKPAPVRRGYPKSPDTQER